MIIKTPIPIDFLEFFKTGKFDCIKLGQTKEWILNNFSNPDSRFDERIKKDGFDIWTYGNIEFHFFGEELFLIFSDHFLRTKLRSGKKLKLNRWIFKDTSRLQLSYVLLELNKNNIDFKKKTDNLGIKLRLTSGLELTFENREDIENLDPNDFELSSFALIEEIPQRWI
ncbi:hypothetical protein LZQ00_03000 [Sphingobacterium sp. SRCM116780]|uniref:hypothetical protein n=1 Tax=Sphingobacterium sp. SRCM116780 TaxID=2907623 RepID=UPI001F379B1A|nr:hypothetical protein [Sphingobacterium sp. SRCM116780]UIR56792.1 hypothetical protein LZQ00_03000 [Sphingobacterium sp. SRCM116780]